MASTILCNESGVSSSIGELKEALSSYQGNVGILENYISEMSSSGSWKDENVKTSFIAAARGYIAAYKAFSLGIEGYIDCLTKKTDNIMEHESNFTK